MHVSSDYCASVYLADSLLWICTRADHTNAGPQVRRGSFLGFPGATIGRSSNLSSDKMDSEWFKQFGCKLGDKGNDLVHFLFKDQYRLDDEASRQEESRNEPRRGNFVRMPDTPNPHFHQHLTHVKSFLAVS